MVLGGKIVIAWGCNSMKQYQQSISKSREARNIFFLRASHKLHYGFRWRNNLHSSLSESLKKYISCACGK